ncbi:hypothetical protein CBS101457_005286 [Exobasidium rhododendri]|nr:hypothetical protein CBS101457_005286 [Exobasidium rhododendri]
MKAFLTGLQLVVSLAHLASCAPAGCRGHDLELRLGRADPSLDLRLGQPDQSLPPPISPHWHEQGHTEYIYDAPPSSSSHQGPFYYQSTDGHVGSASWQHDSGTLQIPQPKPVVNTTPASFHDLYHQTQALEGSQSVDNIQYGNAAVSLLNQRFGPGLHMHAYRSDSGVAGKRWADNDDVELWLPGYKMHEPVDMNKPKWEERIHRKQCKAHTNRNNVIRGHVRRMIVERYGMLNRTQATQALDYVLQEGHRHAIYFPDSRSMREFSRSHPEILTEDFHLCRNDEKWRSIIASWSPHLPSTEEERPQGEEPGHAHMKEPVEDQRRPRRGGTVKARDYFQQDLQGTSHYHSMQDASHVEAESQEDGVRDIAYSANESGQIWLPGYKQNFVVNRKVRDVESQQRNTFRCRNGEVRSMVRKMIHQIHPEMTNEKVELVLERVLERGESLKIYFRTPDDWKNYVQTNKAALEQGFDLHAHAAAWEDIINKF